jgi:hypothetical protein
MREQGEQRELGKLGKQREMGEMGKNCRDFSGGTSFVGAGFTTNVSF